MAQIKARQRQVSGGAAINPNWVTDPSVDLEPGQYYHVSPTTSLVLPSVESANGKPIYLSRDWANVDQAATIALADGDQPINTFPASGDEVVNLWPFSNETISGWVILASPRG